MRIVVTGAVGFIGQVVTARLQSHGHEVTVVDYWRDLLRVYEENRYPITEGVYRTLSASVDVLEPEEFLRSVGRLSPEVVVHLGARADTTDLGSQELYADNVGFTRRLLRELESCGLERRGNVQPFVIFASSAATYGTRGFPNNPYGLTKVIGERLLGRYTYRHAALRFFNVFGEHEHHKGAMASVPFRLAQAYRSGNRFDLHSPDAARDFVPVSTVAEVIGALVHSSDISGVHDLGTGAATTFSDLDTYVMQVTGNRVSVCRSIPMPEALRGRYQGFTCAGLGEHRNLGRGSLSTRDGILEAYATRT